MDLETVIGLEVHIELSTSTKLFCGCSTAYGAPPNTQCCPVCTGMPGSLPLLNKKAVELAIKMGLATNCRIEEFSTFDRKNYFYPDLPKGYQITQHYRPICADGYLHIEIKGRTRKIGISRIQLEEDAGKLIHNESEKVSLIDYNRAGIPLIEIVTRPDIRSAQEAVECLDNLRLIALYMGISDCKMQEGSLRCDVNISVKPAYGPGYGTRVEIKNLNSFKAVRNAIEYESERLKTLMSGGSRIVAETRRWDDSKNVSEPIRLKEDAQDYQYFPDPDLPGIRIDRVWIEQIHSTLPELPQRKRQRYIQELGLSEQDARLLTSEPDIAAFFEACVEQCGRPKEVCNWVTGPLAGLLKDKRSSPGTGISPVKLVGLVELVEKGIISNTIAVKVLAEMLETGLDAVSIVDKYDLRQITDERILADIVDHVLGENQDTVRDYKSGKTKAFTFLMGQAMKASRGKAKPEMLRDILRKRLEI
ncbi:MAG TPA: Asp-tRNA(Asn)/Glu-tRNA(Gln) amidotransferase subunit GatB [Candidatus Atribacteria bacterium]|mgnify:CR=1 FL=1|nr:Asp-tRNA(Asn)/Glu-tRNA(Gln) amidotransferase subunit GatB [Candidatus Atribacteria bacterium]HPT77784.1 Asp-tRNA(Asn)/Glu-tRNA(Gln) amidotransferase subunit GatB [Candidatus Atribacteria bacterium]